MINGKFRRSMKVFLQLSIVLLFASITAGAQTPPSYIDSGTNVLGTVIYVTFSKAMMAVPPAAPAGFTVTNGGNGNVVTSVTRNGTNPAVLDLALTNQCVYGESITVAYTAGTVTSDDGGVLATFTAQTVYNGMAIPPVLNSAATNSAGNVIYATFSKAMDDTGSLPAAPAGFAVSVNGGGKPASVSAVARNAGNPAILDLTLDFGGNEPIVSTDTTTFTYTQPGVVANRILASDDGVLATFTGQSVTNATPISPIVSSASSSTDGTTVHVTFSKVMSNSLPAAPAGFTVTVNGGGNVVTGVSRNGTNTSQLDLTLTSAIEYQTDTVRVSYVKPAFGSPRVLASDDGILNDFTNQSVTNNLPVAPTVSSATTDTAGTKVIVTFSKVMSSSLPAAPAGFTVSVGGLGNVVTAVARNSTNTSAIDLTLTTEVVYGETILVSYTEPGSDPRVKADDTAILRDFTGQSVTNATPTPPTVVSAETSVDGMTVYVTFNKAMSATLPASPAGFTISIGGVGRTITGVAQNANTAIYDITIQAPKIVYGQTVTVSYSDPGVGTRVRSSDGALLGDFSGQAVTNNSPTPPTQQNAQTSTNGETVTVAFDKTMMSDYSALPANGYFSVTVNGISNVITAVARNTTNTSSIDLTLTTPVVYGEEVRVAYTDPGTDPRVLADDDGILGSFSNFFVMNYAPAPPVYSSSTTSVDGDEVIVTFDKTMSSTIPTAPAGFTVSVGGVGRSISTVTRNTTNTSALDLNLATPVIYGDVVTVAFNKPVSAPYVRSDDNAILQTFAAKSVTNALLAPPTVSSAATDQEGTQVIVTFSKEMMASPPSGAAGFVVTAAGNPRTITSVARDGVDTSKLNLNISASTPIVYGDTVLVSYTPGTVSSSDGGVLAAFAGQAVSNNLLAPPTFSSATTNVEGTKILVTFSKNMSATLPTSPAGFVVTAASVQQTISSVVRSAGDNKVLEITLDTSNWIIFGNNVFVRYTKPGSEPWVRADDTAILATFGDTGVTNAMVAPPTYVGSTASGDGTKVEVTFSKTMAAALPASPAGFAVTVNAGNAPITSVVRNATSTSQIDLTLQTPVVSGDVIQVSYTDPGASGSRVLADDDGILADVANQVVNNPLTPPPTVSSASTGTVGTVVSIQFNKAMMASPPAAPSGFSVKVNGGTKTIETVVRNGGNTSQLDLTLQESHYFQAGDTILVSYTDPGPGPNRVLAADDGILATFTDQAVTNNMIAAPTYSSGEVDQDGKIILTFSKAMMAVLPAAPAGFAVTVGGSNNVVTNVERNASSNDQLFITVTTGVEYGDTVQVAYTDPGPSGSRVTANDGGILATFTAQTLTNNMVAPPTFTTGGTDTLGTMISATFSKDMMASPPAAPAGFTVMAGGSPVVVTGVARATNTTVLELTLQTSITNGQTINLTYTDPYPSNRILAADNGILASFGPSTIDNNVPAPPTFVSAGTSTNGETVEVTFSKNMLSTLPAAPAGFTVTVGGVGNAVTRVKRNAGDFTVLDLRLTTPITYGQTTIRVSYTDPGGLITNRVQSEDEGILATFTLQTVTNNLPAPPTYVSSTTDTDGTKVLVTFSKDMKDTGDLPPAPGGFTVNVNGTPNVVTALARNSSDATVIELTLTSSFGFFDNLTVLYTDPGVDPRVRADDGGILATFPSKTVTNAMVSPPDYSSATTDVEGTKLLLTFTKDMSATIPAVPAGFVISDGAANFVIQTIVQSSSNNAIYEFTLDTGTPGNWFEQSDTITISYTDPGPGPNRVYADDNGVLGTFVTQPVTNAMIAPPTVSSATTSVDGTRVLITFSKAMMTDFSALPVGAGFSVKRDGGAIPLVRTEINASDTSIIDLRLDTTAVNLISSSNVILVSFTDPGPGTDRVLSGDDGILASFVDNAVTNAMVAPPTFVSAETDALGKTVTVKLSKEMMSDFSGLPTDAGFTVKYGAGATTNTITAVTRSASNTSWVDLTVQNTLYNDGNPVTVSYADPGPGTDRVLSSDSGILASFTDESVTINTPAPPSIQSVTIYSTDGNTSNTDPYIKNSQAITLRVALTGAQTGVAVSGDFTNIYTGSDPKRVAGTAVTGTPGSYDITFTVGSDNTHSNTASGTAADISFFLYDGLNYVQDILYGPGQVLDGGLWLDNSAPSITNVVDPNAPKVYITTDTITLDITASDSNPYVVTGDFSPLVSGASMGTHVVSATPGAPGAFQLQFTVPASSQSGQVYIYATDSAENTTVDSTHSGGTIQIDNDLPVLEHVKVTAINDSSSKTDRYISNDNKVTLHICIDEEVPTGLGGYVHADFSNIYTGASNAVVAASHETGTEPATYEVSFTVPSDNAEPDSADFENIVIKVYDGANTLTENWGTGSSPAGGLWLDNTAPTVSTVQYRKPDLLASPIEVNDGDITIEVLFNETMDILSTSRPTIKLVQKVAVSAPPNPYAATVEATFSKWATTNNTNDTYYATATLPGQLASGTIETEVKTGKDIALNDSTHYVSSSYPFVFDRTQPAVSSLAIKDTYGNSLNCTHDPASSWYMKYDGSHLSKSNVTALTVEVTITELNNLQDVTLNWRVASNSQEGSAALTQASYAAGTQVYKVTGLSLLSGGVTSMSSTDTVTFWLTGTDKAGNGFSNGNSYATPASTSTLSKMVPVSYLYGEINPRYVLPSKSHQSFLVYLKADLRYYDLGLDKFQTNLNSASLFGESGSITVDGSPITVTEDFNGNMISLYPSSAVEPVSGVGGTREILITFALSSTLTVSDLTGKTFSTLAGLLSASSDDMTATAANVDGTDDNNNSFLVITQDIFSTMNAAIVPNSVPLDTLVDYTVEVQSTYVSSDIGVNKLYILVPAPHYLDSLVFPWDGPAYDGNLTRVGTVEIAAATAAGSGGTVEVVLDSSYYKSDTLLLPFSAVSRTSDYPTGKDFQVYADYLVDDVQYHRSTLKQATERTTGGDSLNVITQDMVPPVRLAYDPLAARPNQTGLTFTATVTPQSGGSTFGGYDTFKIMSGPLGIRGVSSVTVAGANVTFSTIPSSFPQSPTAAYDETVEIRLSSTRITQNSHVAVITFSADTGAADAGAVYGKVEDIPTGEEGTCLDTYDLRIGTPLTSATGSIQAVVNGSTMEVALNEVPAGETLGWLVETTATIGANNTGIDKITIGLPSGMAGVTIKRVKADGVLLTESASNSGWTWTSSSNDRIITTTDLMRTDGGVIEVYFEATTPATLNTSLAFTLNLDNKHTMASSPVTVSPFNGTPKYTRQVATTAKSVLVSPVRGKQYTQKGVIGSYVAEVAVDFVSPNDYEIDSIGVDISGHSGISISQVTFDTGGGAAVQAVTPPNVLVPSYVVLDDVNNSLDSDGTIAVTFTATAPSAEDFSGTPVIVSLDHSYMHKPVSSTEFTTGSTTVCTTAVADSLTAQFTPDSIEAGVTSEVLLTLEATIDNTKHLGIDTIEVSLPAGFTTYSKIIGAAAGTSVSTNLYAFSVITTGVPTQGQARVTLDGTDTVRVKFGRRLGTSQTISFTFSMVAAGSENNFTVDVNATNADIQGVVSVLGQGTISTKRRPAITGFSKSELSIVPTPTLGSHTVMTGTTETFFYYVGFRTSAATSGVDKITINLPSTYSDLAMKSGSTEVYYSTNAGAWTSMARTVSIDSTALTINLSSPLNDALATHTVEVAFTATTPFQGEQNDITCSIDNLSFPNSIDTVAGDVEPQGDGYTREVTVQSLIQSASGAISPRNVLVSSAVRFNITTDVTLQTGDVGVDRISIAVPSSYSFLESPKSGAVKYVNFGGTTEISDFDVTVDSEDVITVALKNGTLDTSIASNARRIVVVLELETPSTADASGGGTKFETTLGWDGKASFPVAETSGSLSVRTSETAIQSLSTETRFSVSENLWRILLTVVFSVEMENTEHPEVSLAPVSMSQLSYDVEEISFYGDTWQGVASVANVSDMVSYFDGSIEITLEGLEDIYGNTITSMTDEVNLAPGFAIRAFEHPLVPGLIATVVKTSEGLEGGASPEVTVTVGSTPATIDNLSEISTNTYLGTTTISTSSYYATTVTIGASGTDTGGASASGSYSFSVQKVSAPKASAIASNDGVLLLDIPANTLSQDEIISVLPYSMDAMSESIRQAAPGLVARAPGLPETQELTPVSEAYSVMPSNASLDSPASVKVIVDKRKLSLAKATIDQTGVFKWDGTAWKYVDKIRGKDFVRADVDQFGVYASMADTVPPRISNSSLEEGDVLKYDDIDITFDVTDGGSGVDVVKTQLLLDEVPVETEYDSKAGVIRWLPMDGVEPGDHTLTLSAYDNLGNASAPSTISFAVAGGLGLNRIQVFPNPASDAATIKYFVTSGSTERVRIYIHDSSGARVSTIDGGAFYGFNEVCWDLINDNGEDVANGVYFWRISAWENGKRIEERGKMAVLR